jgi:tryptophan-rich sensory protein
MEADSKPAISRPTALVLSILPALAASLIGSSATLPNIPTWYMSLIKPSFTPPNWIFGPVWTLLYILMAVACYRVLRQENGRGHRRSIAAYFFQAFFNGAWSVAFFGLNSPFLGLVIIAPLWASIIWTMINFWSYDRFAGAVFVPYLAWVSFAIALNLGIWLLNP